MQARGGGADSWPMAAILFVLVIAGSLVAGRAQAQAARDGSALRFPVWELGVVGLLVLHFGAHFAFGTPLPAPVKAIAIVVALAVVALPVLRARRYHDIEDF
jgi:hypothetical protein